MPNNHTKDFALISYDFLKLMAYKSKATDQREFQVLELFYDACKSIIEKADQDIHCANLEGIQEHIKAKILEKELKEVYNELFKRFPSHASELITKSAVPTKKELEQAVVIK